MYVLSMIENQFHRAAVPIVASGRQLAGMSGGSKETFVAAAGPVTPRLGAFAQAEADGSSALASSALAEGASWPSGGSGGGAGTSAGGGVGGTSAGGTSASIGGDSK